jgi:hypothetical protein
MIQGNHKGAGFQAFKTQDGTTGIQGHWQTPAPFLAPDAVRADIRDQVRQRLVDKIPPDLIEKRNRARRLIADCRQDLNGATQARQSAVADLQRCWADIGDLAAIQAAETAAAKADDRVNAVANRLNMAQEKLAAISEELQAILDLAVSEISAEPAPISEAHLAAEAAIQKAFDKHAAALSEAAAVKYFWWSATQRNDGSRDGFTDLARLVLADFQHEPAGADQVEADQVEAVATVAE